MAATRKTLDKWIEEALLDPDKVKKNGERAKCTMFVMMHMVAQNEMEVHRTRFNGLAIEPKNIANLFRSKAETYAQDLVGVQSFVLLAFYEESDEPQARQVFTVNGKTDFAGATESPDERGAKQQTMRHTELVFQQVYHKQQHIDNYVLRLIEHQDKRIAQLTTENMEMFDVFKQMMMEKLQLEHSKTLEIEKERRATEQQKKLLEMAPLLVNTVTGREVFPQSKTDSILLEQIAVSLKPEHVQFLQSSGIINQELAGPLFERLGQILEQKEKEQEARAQLNPRPADPQLEAAGEVQRGR